MTDKASILKRAIALHVRSGLALSTISTVIFNDGKRIAALQAGARAWPETLQAASVALARMEREHKIKVRA